MSQAPASTSTPRRSFRWFYSGIRVTLLTALCCLLLLMIFEERLIFFPSKYDGSPFWQLHGRVYQDVYFEADDGTQLHGWYFAHEAPRAVVLFSHGNAGNITHRLEMANRLRGMGLSVFVFDYRGYGRSQGRPHEKGVLADARAARRALARLSGVPESDIVQMGRSLGGAVAVDLAARDGARGLVVESTFSSMPEVAAVHYPLLPVQRFMRTRLDSLSIIGAYRGPYLQSHGDSDTIVPFHLGKRLYDAVETDNGFFRKFFVIPGGEHNDPQPDDYYRLLDAFIERLP
ncbi:MAG: alpha/beta hydrolase [Planctomycetales bacterium]|nr:alpha/beta hydrolase [Planctomycetales bacterium]NIM08549.1 alpha/beta hydrolase [Planctomycetales bacterium]NIN08020.1 alpha/beta hydrolase [Planctomycetales bacterium]NIN76546.1 alpha/beta hydrolase [Planctomycetales bacterium]NIO33733.1 alpha/beta hydrolase [Planctomycetales bacterium]